MKTNSSSCSSEADLFLGLNVLVKLQVCFYLFALAGVLNFERSAMSAEPGDISVARSKFTPPANDPTVVEASKLGIKVPVMCREWHVWWGSPHGVRPMVPSWIHWDGLKRFGQFEPTTTVEEAVPGLAWRRNLNSVGYPLLGPYEPSQPDIIRWQLETARNAGLDALYVHLWPSIYDDGSDIGPLPLFERILEVAAELKYPVGVHDEVMFRAADISQAQKLDSSIRRLASLVKQYGSHAGWRKIDGMPLIYFQNWNHWISAKDMRTLFEEVEKRSQPVYWMVEMSPDEDYLEIPQLRAYLGPSNSYFLHIPPFGQLPHPWENLEGGMQHACDKARKFGKKVGVLVFSRFNNRNDRGAPGREQIDAEEGRFYVDSLRRAMKLKPDFLVVSQWNDFEESGFLEPAWDCDGWNGDPYRYCRITAAAMNKPFTPARLPRREEVDPWIRHKLFGDSKAGDQGPLISGLTIKRNELNWTWGEGSADPVTIRIVQQSLQTWSADQPGSAKLRLANRLSAEGLGTLQGGQELRFFVPGLLMERPITVWVGVHAQGNSGENLQVNYRSEIENFRWDSHEDRRHTTLAKSARFELNRGDRVYWTPLHSARFAGFEGDLTLRLNGDGPCTVKEVVLWHPEMKGESIACGWQLKSAAVPGSIAHSVPWVVVAYDQLGNAGVPRLIVERRTLPSPSRDPMDLLP